LFTTIRNLYLDQYRRERLIAFAPLDEVAEPANVEPLLDDRVSARDLEAPLAALRPEEREALYLHAVEGYTAQEIAGLTMRARGTVLSLLHRAKRKLAKAIAAGGDRPAPRRQAG
jgi:RNA polymerase sigma-70 factor (ECF subfamily)